MCGKTRLDRILKKNERIQKYLWLASIGEKLRDSFEMNKACLTQARNSVDEKKFFYANDGPSKKRGRPKRIRVKVERMDLKCNLSEICPRIDRNGEHNSCI